jgi:CarD family transcriptional regulator
MKQHECVPEAQGNHFREKGIKMYQKNNVVIYGLHGVCRIAEITEKDFGGEEKLYYTLKPIFDERSTFFVPVQTECSHKKIRPLLSMEEVKDLIRNISQQETIWIPDEKHRKETYKQIIESGDRTEMMKLVKTLYLRKKDQQKAGKKQHIVDEHFMKEAETVLYDEFAYVLDIDRDKVLPFIKKEIAKS